MRVVAFVDGFNLYHAVDDLRINHLKWLNIKALCEQFISSPDLNLEKVLYFSAYATWLPDAYKRHREYIKALRAVGVETVMGRFKEKDRKCLKCGAEWKGHEEKETDVNIALYLAIGAFQNWYDRALLITGDSDLAPAVRMTHKLFPNKEFRLLSPVNRKHSMDLLQAVGGGKYCTKIKTIHLERALFPEKVYNTTGSIIAIRPASYAPPIDIP